MSLQIDASDVVRLMLQYMKENNLLESFKVLSNEAGVCLNTVDSVESFVSDVRHGKWDTVLTQINSMKIPKNKMFDLHEQVVFELLESGERDLAKEMMRTSSAFLSMKTEEPQRLVKLDTLCRRPYFVASDVYEMGSSKAQRRKEIAEALSTEVTIAPPSRLLALLGASLKGGEASALRDGKLDVFQGHAKAARNDAEEKYPTRMAGQIKFEADAHPETVIFSPNGDSLVTGSVDGFVEVWNPETCKLRKDLEYQEKDELMLHDSAVLCSTFSRDGELLATGSQDGQIKVWKLQTGACVRKFPQGHPEGITSLTFAKDCTHLLSTSFDHTARIQGLKSGKTLKEFRGHTSYVNCGAFTQEGQVVTGASDGTVKLWDEKTAECLLTFRPGCQPGAAAREYTVHTIQLHPTIPDLLFVACKSSTSYFVTVHGQVIREFSSGKKDGGDFVAALLSPKGRWVYCVGEDRILYTFNSTSGELENALTIAESNEIIRLEHHPHRNVIVSLTDNGNLRLWRP